VTCRSHQKQKHKSSVTGIGALFLENTLVPPKHEKSCINVSFPRRTRMQYMTHRSHRMEKHKFNVSCPDMLFSESVPIPPKHEK
jgi:hypothetical protein